MAPNDYIPALRFHWLTNMYDWLIRNFMPEKEYKARVIQEAIQSGEERVLDFGMGTGTLSLMLKRTRPDTTVTGIDVDAKIIGIARRKFAEHNTDIDIVQYNGKDFPAFDEPFNSVISSLVFHHLSDKQKVTILKSLYHHLQPGGLIVIADWGKPTGTGQRLLFYIVQLLDGFRTTQSSVDGKFPEMMKQAGFKTITEVGVYGTILGTLRIFKSKKL